MMNKIIIRSFMFSMSLFAIIMVWFHDHISRDQITALSFGFSGLGGMLALVFCLLHWRAQDQQREEDELFGFTQEEMADGA